MFAFDNVSNRLWRNGSVFDAATRSWLPASKPSTAAAIDAVAALHWLQHSEAVIRAPLGVIGPREADDTTLLVAEAVGRVVACCGFALLCGGGLGVMAAACRGAAEAGGLTIGLLPEKDSAAANPYVAVALASGIGEARNAVIATASKCLIAVGDSFGTLSEVAFGRRMGKTVFGLAGAAQVDGVIHLAHHDDLADALAGLFLDFA